MAKVSGTIFINKVPILTAPQLKVVSDIGVAGGQLATGSMILPFLVPGLDRSKMSVIALGMLATIISWLISILVVRKIEI